MQVRPPRLDELEMRGWNAPSGAFIDRRDLLQIFVNALGANIATQSLSVDPVESIEAIKLQVGFIGFPPPEWRAFCCHGATFPGGQLGSVVWVAPLWRLPKDIIP